MPIMSGPNKKRDSVAKELNNSSKEIVKGKCPNAAEILEISQSLKMSVQKLSVSSVISSIMMRRILHFCSKIASLVFALCI